MDTWILLRNSPPGEHGGRHLSILKSRGMAHSSEARAFQLTNNGAVADGEGQGRRFERGAAL
jgi:hypothetical protein